MAELVKDFSIKNLMSTINDMTLDQLTSLFMLPENSDKLSVAQKLDVLLVVFEKTEPKKRIEILEKFKGFITKELQVKESIADDAMREALSLKARKIQEYLKPVEELIMFDKNAYASKGKNIENNISASLKTYQSVKQEKVAYENAVDFYNEYKALKNVIDGLTKMKYISVVDMDNLANAVLKKQKVSFPKPKEPSSLFSSRITHAEYTVLKHYVDNINNFIANNTIYPADANVKNLDLYKEKLCIAKNALNNVHKSIESEKMAMREVNEWQAHYDVYLKLIADFNKFLKKFQKVENKKDLKISPELGVFTQRQSIR